MRFPHLREAVRSRFEVEVPDDLDPVDELWTYLAMALHGALGGGGALAHSRTPWTAPDWLVCTVWETIVDPANRDLLEGRAGRSINPTARDLVDVALARMEEIERSWFDTSCDCFDGRAEVEFHAERQHATGEPWRRLLERIDAAAADGRELFGPGNEMSPRDWSQIVTLPPSIGALTGVRKLVLYSSHLVRIPPEIAGMTSLETFVPYTSYSLHWFPYEITRCPALVESTVSTRALYGNRKERPPYPRLAGGWIDPAEALGASDITRCSVCDGPIGGRMKQVWIDRLVATDVLPLLVNACSDACLDALPAGAEGHPPRPHAGGRFA